VLLALAAAALTWEIVTQAAAAHFQEKQPALALRVGADSADAFARLASARLEAGAPQQAARLAQRALDLDPLHVRALRVLGFAALDLGQGPRGDALLALASDRSWRDTPTHRWLFEDHLGKGEYDAAFEHADALLRRRERFRDAVFADMTAATEDPLAVAALVNRLAGAPSWRTPLVWALAARAQDERQAYAVLAGLREGPAPPTAEEVSVYLDRLIAARKYRKAHAAWRRLAPNASDRPLSDGGFEGAEGVEPFAWSFGQGVGLEAAVEPAPGRAHERALRVEYDGYSTAGDVARQLVALPPGPQRLEGEAFAADREDDRFTWTLSCAGSGVELARTGKGQGASGRWRRFQVRFQVPDSGCEGQWLRLTAEAGERRTRHEAWFDRLALVPVEDSAREIPSDVSS